eukprot:715991_1
MQQKRNSYTLSMDAAQDRDNPVEYIYDIFELNESNGDHEDEEDSLDSEERKAIQQAKIKRDSKNALHLETTLMQQEMKAMADQEKYALERVISGRNTFREEDASKWEKEEIENELQAMQMRFRRLSRESLSIDQVQDEVNKTMQQFRKFSEDAPTQNTTHNVMTMSATPKSPIHEIHTSMRQHTTTSQPVMIEEEQERRNSISESYSHGGAYVMRDTSQYTEQQEPLIKVSGVENKSSGEKNIVMRFIVWYLSSMHEWSSLHGLLYHGANAVLSFVICGIMVTLFCLSVIFLPFCGAGLIFTYFQCLLSRHFAQIESRFSCYLFGSDAFPRFSIFIPSSHEQSVIGALKEYITDPHMLQVIAYFTFIKLPAAFILSGIAMVIFSGVTSILLSPLIFWVDSQYFEDDLYCLFGSRVTDPIHPNKMLCNGWAINSFGETLLVFLVFIPALPLTLHLSNATARMLSKLTLNFLSSNRKHK